jgi:5-methylcytosine-specific restriction protein A
MSLRVCTVPSCPELVTAGEGRCPTHRREADRRRGTAHQRGYDRKWARTRGRYLQLHPTCEQPHCTTSATDVHHLDGLGPNSPRGHKHDNLQALCSTHHKQVTARDQPGGWAALG